MHRAHKHRPDAKRQSAQIQHSTSAHETPGQSNTRSSLGTGAAREEAARAITLLSHPTRARASYLLRGEGSRHDCCGVYRGTLQFLKCSARSPPVRPRLVNETSVLINMCFYSSFYTNPHFHARSIKIYISKYVG